MSSFIFNDFRERYIKGEVPANDTWYAVPVTSKFTNMFDNDDIKASQFKNKFQLNLYANNVSGCSLESTYANLDVLNWAYTEVKDERAESDATVKPTFVSRDNWSEFISAYKSNDAVKKSFDRLFNKFFGTGEFANRTTGFYWVTNKEELAWCANRVNGYADGEYTDNYNNEIVIVLGDDIGPDDAHATKIITNADGSTTSVDNRNVFDICIGKKANRPFNGIFYGNGHKIQNFIIECTSECNGLFGFVGPYGIVCHTIICGRNTMRCVQKLNMTHIKNKGTDIETALLVGHNYGLVSYNTIKGTVEIEDFIPAVYPVENKEENVINPVGTDPDVNMHYPNYLCINSPGNVIPYIGYFNEGVVATLRKYSQDLSNVSDKVHAGTDDWSKVWSVMDKWWIITKSDSRSAYHGDCYFTSYADACNVREKMYDFSTNKGKAFVFPNEGDLADEWPERAGAAYYCPDDAPPLIVFEPSTANYSTVYNAFKDAKIDFSAYSATPRAKEYFSNIGNDDEYGIGCFFGKKNSAILYDYNAENFVSKQLLPNENTKGDSYEAGDCFVSDNFGFMSNKSSTDDMSLIADNMSACPWFDASMKMQQASRAAYYLSPLAGWSNGALNNNYIAVNMQFNNEFAGFAGGLVGKFAGGSSNDNHILLNVSDTYLRNEYVLSAESDAVDNLKQINMYLDSYTHGSDMVTYYGGSYEVDGKTVYCNPYYRYDTNNAYRKQSNLRGNSTGFAASIPNLESGDFPYNSGTIQGTFIDVYDLQNWKFTSQEYSFSGKDWNEVNDKIYKAIDRIALKGSAVGFIPDSHKNKTTITKDTYENSILMAANFRGQNITKSNIETHANVVQSAHCYIPLTSYSTVAYRNSTKNNTSAFAEDKIENYVIPEDKWEIDPTNGWIKVTDCPTWICDFVLQEELYNGSLTVPASTPNMYLNRLNISVYDRDNNWKYQTNSPYYIDDNVKANLIYQNFPDFSDTKFGSQEHTNFKHKVLGNYLHPRVMWFEKVVPENQTFSQTEGDTVWQYNGSNLRLKAMSGVHITCVNWLSYATSYKQATAKFADLYIPYLEGDRIYQSASAMPFEAGCEKTAQAEFDYKLNGSSKSYIQELKSIHNVGGFAGSLIYGDCSITNNEVALNNNIQYFIKTEKDADGNEEPVFDGTTTHDYSMLNRYGALAAVCEFNSAVAPDYWEGLQYPLKITGNKFKYDEPGAKVINGYLAIGPMQLGQWETFGVASPLIAEIKPTYLSVPSIISYNTSFGYVDWDGNENLKDIKSNNQFGYAYYGLFTHDHGLKWDNFDAYVYTYNQNLDMPSRNAWNKDDTTRQIDTNKVETDNWFDIDISKMICKMTNWKDNQVYLNSFGVVTPTLNPNYDGGEETETNLFFSDVYLDNKQNGYRITNNPLKTMTYPMAAEDLQYELTDYSEPKKKKKRSWLTRACNVIAKTIEIPLEAAVATVAASTDPDPAHATHMLANGIYRYLTRTTKRGSKTLYTDASSFKNAKKSSLFPYFGSSLSVGENHTFWYDCCMAGDIDENDEVLKNAPATTWDGNVDMNTKTENAEAAGLESFDIFTYEYHASEKDLKKDGSHNKFDKIKMNVQFNQDGAGKLGYWMNDNDSYYTNPSLHLGCGKKPADIRYEIRHNKDQICYTSSVSGEDFQGLFIFDSNDNNVMYIDTKVGDMNGYSLWNMNLPQYVAKNKHDSTKGGLILEIK